MIPAIQGYNKTPIQFTSKMNIAKNITDQVRWKNIADSFEHATKGSSYNMEVDYNGKTINVETSFFNKQCKDLMRHCINISEEGSKKLLGLKDSEVVGKFIKLENIYKQVDKLYTECAKFMDQLEKTDIYDTLCNEAGNRKTHYDNIFQSMLSKHSDDIKTALNSDDVLKEAEIVY